MRLVHFGAGVAAVVVVYGNNPDCALATRCAIVRLPEYQSVKGLCPPGVRRCSLGAFSLVRRRTDAHWLSE
jgi:hypothetical protein